MSQTVKQLTMIIKGGYDKSSVQVPLLTLNHFYIFIKVKDTQLVFLGGWMLFFCSCAYVLQLEPRQWRKVTLLLGPTFPLQECAV